MHVAVIGGGIVGLGAAWALAMKGHAVALLEQGRLGGSTSSGTFAWLNASSKTDDESYHRLNAAGLATYEGLAATFGREAIGLHGQGSLQWVAASDPMAEELRRQAAILNAWGYGAELLDRAALQAKAPGFAYPSSALGLFAPKDRWLEVPRLLVHLRRALQEKGAVIKEGAKAIGAVTKGGRLRAIKTKDAEIACDAAVLAAGAETPAVLAVVMGADAPAFMRVKPGLLVESESGSGADLGQIVAWAPDAAGFHLRPTAAGGLLLGADDVDDAVGEGSDPGKIDQGIEVLQQRAEGWLPRLKGTPWRQGCRWRIGRRAIPADGHSLVGPVAALPGLYLAVTHSGVTLALHLGRLLAESLGGPMPDDLRPFSPSRLGL